MVSAARVRKPGVDCVARRPKNPSVSAENRPRHRPVNVRCGGAREGHTVREHSAGDEVEEVEGGPTRERRRRYSVPPTTRSREVIQAPPDHASCRSPKEGARQTRGAGADDLSLARLGATCVLMPNTGRGGGVSRKITSLSDRRRPEGKIPRRTSRSPRGMGVIVPPPPVFRAVPRPRSKRDLRIPAAAVERDPPT